MKFNLLKASALLCGLFLLGSCAQEAPQADNKTTLEDGPRVAVPIELEVSVDAFDAPKSLDQEARAYTGAKTPITVKDGNNKVLNDDLTPHPTEAQKILTRSRAKFIEKNPTLDAVVKVDVKKGTDSYTSIEQAKLAYNSTKAKYTFDGPITIDQNVMDQAKQSGATTTLTIYAGGEYDAANKTFKLSSVMEEVSLSDLATTPIELPILYKSEPVAFKVVNDALKPANSTSAGTLKPLGSLLLVTFRNNMQQTVTFDGINAVSNSFFGPNNSNKKAVYDIATGAFSNTVSYESPYAKSTEGGAGYTFFYKDFSSGSSSLPGSGGISIASGASADKAIVFWGFHTGGSAKVSTSNKLKAVTGASMEADILTPSTSLLHVYGHNVKVGSGLTPSRPNYSIAPIGGANLTPENGKAYTLNCEFYEQPRQMLGYFAKGYIYKENNATWKDYNFDGNGSNDPNEYLKKSPSAGSGYKDNGKTDRTSSADNFLLVNSMQANEVRAAKGGVTTTKGQMYLPNESWLNLLGLNRPIAFASNGNSDGRYKTLAGFSSSRYYRGQIVPAQLPYKDDPTASGSFQYKGFVYADYHKDYQTLTSGQLAVAYRQLYMEPRNGSGYQPRSKYQTIMRVKTTGLYTLVENEGGVDYGTFPSTLTMESLYVGKYFVGNVMTTPLYVTRGASQPFLYAESEDGFWHKPEVSRDRVDRALLNVPTFDYNQIGTEEILQDAGKTSFRNKTKAAPLMNHWGDAPTDVWYSRVIGKTKDWVNYEIHNAALIVSGDPRQVENRVYGFADGAKGYIWVMALRVNTTTEHEIVKGRMRTYTYQVLRPYSSKYQGNQGFRNNND